MTTLSNLLKYRIPILVPILLFHLVFSLNGQGLRKDHSLFAPSQINRYCTEQIEDYILAHEQALKSKYGLLQIKTKKLSSLKAKKIQTKKNERRIQERQEELHALGEIIHGLEMTKTQWEEILSQRKLFQLDSYLIGDTCYDIIGRNRTFSSEDYLIEDAMLGDTFYWTETLTPETSIVSGKKVEVSPASAKWVKKKANINCLSDDPNDCLVWCLVETPATYEYPEKKKVFNCPEDFFLDDNLCVRNRSVLTNDKAFITHLAMDVVNDREIVVVGLKRGKCK